MAFNPEILFGKYYTNLGDWRGAGISYYPRFNNVSDYTEVIHFGSIKELDLNDLDDTIHTSVNDGLQIELCDFGNDVKLVAVAWVETAHAAYGDVKDIIITTRLKYGTTLYNPFGFPGATATNVGGFWTGSTVVVYFPYMYKTGTYSNVRLAILYAYPQSSAVEDVTKLESIVVRAWVPNRLSDRYTGDLVDIFDTTFLVDDKIWNMPYGSEDWYMYHNFGKSPVSLGYSPLPPADIFAIGDMEQFVTAINQIHQGADMDDIMGDERAEGEPSQDFDPSGQGGGDGDYTGGVGGSAGGYDKKSDPIDFPPLPTGGALATGSIRGFLVSTTIIQQVFNKLWSTSIFDPDNWQKLLEAPLDALVSLQVIPCTPSNDGGSGAVPIRLGDFDCEVTAPVITNQYLYVDAGTITVKPYWGSALDFSPYTKISIYLPFIGIRDLRPEDVVSLPLHVKYTIDVLTGDLVAHIKCGMSVLYKFNGNCRGNIPVSSKTFEGLANMYKGMAMTGGAAALAGSMANPAIAMASFLMSATNVAMSKTYINRSGNLAGVAGLIDDFNCYLIIHRPVQSLADRFKTFKGYPSNITATLSSLKGYTEIEHINLSVPGATDEELVEIERLLKEGVII